METAGNLGDGRTAKMENSPLFRPDFLSSRASDVDFEVFCHRVVPIHIYL